ncbi:aconitate hydratase AcnA [Enterococcus wangshanyuanii]|uniref:Aconitate hydratase n=1 Tax=Enterococcus wangshanyuanii TaxID=2005703 RepID=A0ABQ1NK14_9ENTE|nr:aconitate hydratase AcnA [Enterococcus wangshanyuanii]GGC79119.1 aconitate hydratase [Enterococcus wangshanyuanii]
MKRTIIIQNKEYTFFSLKALAEKTGADISRLPYSIRILLENILRQETAEGDNVVHQLVDWNLPNSQKTEIPFKPGRVILQDLTGGAAIVDLASLRKAVKDFGQDPKIINPEIPVDLVIDHSVQVDFAGLKTAFQKNEELEFVRNMERYSFFKWAEQSFDSFRVVPPATGIVHQVNLEYLADVVTERDTKNENLLFPDTLVGTDSHTTMINALGVLGWGVGGIEAEAGMLGQPCYLTTPDVIGVRLTGSLKNGATATDLALTLTQLLREKNVVGKFVEYFGEGLAHLTVSDRSVVANMAPEYGATCGFFPIDQETLNYLDFSGRDPEQRAIIEAYVKENQLFYDAAKEADYTEIIELNLSDIEPSLAGPKRPQDLVPLSKVKQGFIDSLTKPNGNSGYGLAAGEEKKQATINYEDGTQETIETGAVVIASITSCTNTSNPFIVLSAGLLAKKAVEKGLSVKQYVKTSLSPGSKVATRYFEDAGLLPYLEKLGFDVIGYGCMTCVGNSGPLDETISQVIQDENLLVSAVLSGNRNFEGRIHADVKAGYLAAPHLVIAYALAGNVNVDLTTEPLGYDSEGAPVYLKDIMPSNEEVEQLINRYVKTDLYKEEYGSVFNSNQRWNNIETTPSMTYEWDERSTYIANPPYFEALESQAQPIQALKNQRVLAKLGDSITTDHLSPVGSIPLQSPAGRYLTEHGVRPQAFNSYGSRRGNHEVMVRGTLNNIRLRNELADGKEGGYTKHFPTGEILTIFDASEKYLKEDGGLLILAGEDYGMGSSRDWAAKGVRLLGVNTVIAKSFERIHRSNLLMMGVLPLQFVEGQDADSLGLTGEESFDFIIDDSIKPNDIISVRATSPNGDVTGFKVRARFESETEIDYYRNQEILPMVLRNKLS